jgi:hypothetical protein
MKWRMRSATIALAVALGGLLAPQGSAAETVPAAPVEPDFSAWLEPADSILPDPQPPVASAFPEGELGFAAPEGEERHVFRQPPAPTLWDRPAELNDVPMAPLPPAIVAGPIGIAFASVMAWRANRRGGRV